MDCKKYLTYCPYNKCTWRNNRYALLQENILSMQTEISSVIIYDPKFIFQDLIFVLAQTPPVLSSDLYQKSEDS